MTIHMVWTFFLHLSLHFFHGIGYECHYACILLRFQACTSLMNLVSISLLFLWWVLYRTVLLFQQGNQLRNSQVFRETTGNRLSPGPGDEMVLLLPLHCSLSCSLLYASYLCCACSLGSCLRRKRKDSGPIY